MTAIQFVFADYEAVWPLQSVPEHWKRKGPKTIKPPEPQTFPVVPYIPMLKALEIKGRFKYPKGHTRANVDNPARSDTNQSCWLLVRQMPGLGLSEREFTRYLKALLCYGFVEQRLGHHGRRCRISWYGQIWLKEQAQPASS
jgi:hypothetical protein